jgi:proteasome lid subunit RPN8/RPN11
MSLLLHTEAKAVIEADARACFPDECCGFFYGRKDGSQRIVTQAKPVVNAKEGDKRRRFEIHPIDYMKAERYAIENGLDLLGVYHSHPLHPAIPSEHDREVAFPEFSYIIASVQPDAVEAITSWRLNEARQFDPEEVREP